MQKLRFLLLSVISIQFVFSVAFARYPMQFKSQLDKLGDGENIEPVKELFKPNSKTKQSRFIESFSKDNIWMTFASDVDFVGPIQDSYYLKSGDYKNKKRSEYVKNIFNYIVYRAHQLSKQYYNNGENIDFSNSTNDNFTYYSFLVLALSVPYHESHLTHARTIPGRGNCFKTINDLSIKKYHKPIKKYFPRPYVRTAMKQLYKDSGHILMPECQDIGTKEETSQVLWSYLYDDVGLWQINPYSHPSSLLPEFLLNLNKTIDWGLTYLFYGENSKRSGGFKYIRDTAFKGLKDDRKGLSTEATKYVKTCGGFLGNPYKEHKNSQYSIYSPLLQASWAGSYNSGTSRAISKDRNGKITGGACRFAVDKSRLRRDLVHNDPGFLKKLNRVIKTNSSIYHNQLPKGSLERKVLDEIIHNYRAIFAKRYHRPKEKNSALTLLLAKNFATQNSPTFIYPEREEGLSHHLILPGKVKYYVAPHNVNNKLSNEGLYCGYLESENLGSGGLVLHSSQKDSVLMKQDMSLWIKFQFPKYAKFGHQKGEVEYLQPKVDSGEINIRIKEKDSKKRLARKDKLIGDLICINQNADGNCIDNLTVKKIQESEPVAFKVIGRDIETNWWIIDLGDPSLGDNGRGYVTSSESLIKKTVRSVKVNRELCDLTKSYYIEKSNTLSFNDMGQIDLNKILVRSKLKIYDRPSLQKAKGRKILGIKESGDLLYSIGTADDSVAISGGKTAIHRFHRVVYPEKPGCDVSNFSMDTCTAYVFSNGKIVVHK